MGLPQLLHGVILLSSLVVSVPIAFHVGGRTDGLRFTLSLALAYFISSCLIIALKRHSSKREVLASILGFFQLLLVPALFTSCVGLIVVDRLDGRIREKQTLSREVSKGAFVNMSEVISKDFVEDLVVRAWDSLVTYSSSFIQILEGLCSLFVIQSAGRAARVLVNKRKSDATVMVILAMSAMLISSSILCLWQNACHVETRIVDVILTSITATSTIFLGVWGIAKAKSNSLESSLLLSYITYCIYQVSATYLLSMQEIRVSRPFSDNLPTAASVPFSNLTSGPVISPLMAGVYTSLTSITHALQMVPTSIQISFAYRVFIFSIARHSISAVDDQKSPAETTADKKNYTSLLMQLKCFSLSILVFLYTTLLNDYFLATKGVRTIISPYAPPQDLSKRKWGWANIWITVILYAIGLYLRNGDIDEWLNGC